VNVVLLPFGEEGQCRRDVLAVGDLDGDGFGGALRGALRLEI